VPGLRYSLTLAVLAAWLVSGPASGTTTLNGQGFCYWPVATTALDVQSGGQGSALAVSVNGTGHVEQALLDSMFNPCDPPKLTRDCTASATATLDYGLVAADMTAQVSYAPDTYACPDGSSGDTVGAAAAIETRFNGEFRDSVTVNSSTLAVGTPVQVLATVSLDAAGSASGTTIPYGTPSYGPNIGIALRLDVDDGVAQLQIYGAPGPDRSCSRRATSPVSFRRASARLSRSPGPSPRSRPRRSGRSAAAPSWRGRRRSPPATRAMSISSPRRAT
jgi:hypothetical protein